MRSQSLDGCSVLGQVKTKDGHTVVAKDAVVLATNSPINKNLALHPRQHPGRSYVLGFEVPKVRCPCVLMNESCGAIRCDNVQLPHALVGSHICPAETDSSVPQCAWVPMF